MSPGVRGHVAFALTFLAFVASSSQLNFAQNSTPRVVDPSDYLGPNEPSPAGILCVLFAEFGEPSLFKAASNDPALYSFRVSAFAPVLMHKVAVRLVIDADGNGHISSANESYPDGVLKRTKEDVEKTDVDKFLEIVNRAKFWTAPTHEPQSNPIVNGRPAYTTDGSDWMLEGVRNGTFHYVFRENPEHSALTAVGCFLARDLVKTASSPIPMAGCTHPDPPNPRKP